LPALPPAEFEALKADIVERGVVVPIDIDEDGEILDGHTRYQAWLELRKNDPPPAIVRAGLSEQEKRAFARKNNILRRHLTREQVRTLVAAQLKDTPNWADNRIAKEIGVDGKTVEGVRSGPLSTSEIPKFDRLVGADGKERPAKQPRHSTAKLDHDNNVVTAAVMARAFGIQNYDPKAVDALPTDLKLAMFNAGIPKNTAILMPNPLPNPAVGLTDTQIRQWEQFADFLVAQRHESPDTVVDHIEWLWRHDFKTPDEWLGEEGERYRAAVTKRLGSRHSWTMPENVLKAWNRFKLTAAE
jgi:ParB-like chromosome segregation protein Spo0J